MTFDLTAAATAAAIVKVAEPDDQLGQGLTAAPAGREQEGW